jgi:hypothetical protein
MPKPWQPLDVLIAAEQPSERMPVLRNRDTL